MNLRHVDSPGVVLASGTQMHLYGVGFLSEWLLYCGDSRGRHAATCHLLYVSYK